MGAQPNKVKYHAGKTALGASGLTQVFDKANAVSDRTGPGGHEVLLVTGGDCATIIDGILFHAKETNAACCILIWYHNFDANIDILIGDIAVAANTASATAAGKEVVWVPPIKQFVIEAGDYISFETTDSLSDWFGTIVGGHLDVADNEPGQTHPL